MFESNGPMLAALAAAVGLESTTMACQTDDPERFTATITAAAVAADLIITSGGVSMGSYEVVKSVLGEREGFEFRQVAMQPGKPQGFGRLDKAIVLNLPGNPVSATVSFMVFARPVIARLAGREPAEMFPAMAAMPLSEDVERKAVRQFLRGNRDSGPGLVVPSPA
ncbi:MAG: molybdopterin-binding protein, partial [Candidatus Nanopelagicales bacterium]|nr:molybdopterin-binding protein [Candidatus Nanopelagicales bacterium]